MCLIQLLSEYWIIKIRGRWCWTANMGNSDLLIVWNIFGVMAHICWYEYWICLLLRLQQSCIFCFWVSLCLHHFIYFVSTAIKALLHWYSKLLLYTLLTTFYILMTTFCYLTNVTWRVCIKRENLIKMIVR